MSSELRRAPLRQLSENEKLLYARVQEGATDEIRVGMSISSIHSGMTEEFEEMDASDAYQYSDYGDRTPRGIAPRRFGGSATYPTKFNSRWKSKYPFICEVPENRHLFLCMVCSKVLSCSHQGLADVKRHVNSRSHFDKVRKQFGNIKRSARGVNNSIVHLANGNTEIHNSLHSGQDNVSSPQQLTNNFQNDELENSSNSQTTVGTQEDESRMPSNNSTKVKKREDYLQWPDYFMAIAFLSAMRSKDPNSQVGACIINSENKIVGIGYNGMPNGCSDDELPWSREGSSPLDTKYMYVCHAEMNAILNKNSAEIRGSTIYVALFPCNECAKLIIQSGIREVVYLSDRYHSDHKMVASRRLFDMAGVSYRQHVPKMRKIVIDFDSLDGATKAPD